MTSKWYRKEEKQTEHPGQMELDFSTASHPARRDQSETRASINERPIEKETT